MTLTERKRAKHPKRYLVKDARNAIYAVLFGQVGQERGRGSNDPFLDETRRLPEDFSHPHAVRVFDDLVEAARFSPQRQKLLEQRLESLRRYKPRTAEDKVLSQVIDAYVAML